MATKTTTKQRATKESNCAHEHIEPKNEGVKTTKNAKSGRATKDCK